MRETWYCYQKKQEHRTDEVRITVYDDAPTKKDSKKAEKLMLEGYKLIRKQELGQTKKCKG